jgi:hypothetical protein
VILVLIALAVSAVMLLGLVPTPAPAVPLTPLASPVSDDFTHDSSLNAALWQVNGPVASNFSSENCPGCSLITLTPSFSSAGMEIADADANSVIGAIQSVQNFTPPLTVTARVEGIVSDGHPFVFGITSQNASSGIQITGNLNPNDCSALSNCGNPSTCGTPFNSSIAANQCFYGIYARSGTSGGNWKKSPSLDLTPAVGVVYTLTAAVDGSGNALFNVSAGGQQLGQATGQVGTGPFYIIMGQSEGVPVPGPGANQAVWLSISLSPTANIPGPTASSPSVSIPSWVTWLLVAWVVVVVLLVVAWSRRRRNLTILVQDSGSLSPVFGAGVSAEGPRSFSGSTGRDGTVAFGGVKAGDYSVKAAASGYSPSVPFTISVRRTVKQTVRLDRAGSPAPDSAAARPAPEGPERPPDFPSTVATLPAPPGPAAERAPSPVAPAAPPSGPAESEGLEGWGGERIRQIVETFRAKGAISPETALTAEELGLSRLFVRIMKRRRGRTRVFVEANGRYYLNEDALREMK